MRGTEGGTTYVDSAMNAGECEEDSSHSEMRDRTNLTEASHHE